MRRKMADDSISFWCCWRGDGHLGYSTVPADVNDKITVGTTLTLNNTRSDGGNFLKPIDSDAPLQCNLHPPRIETNQRWCMINFTFIRYRY